MPGLRLCQGGWLRLPPRWEHPECNENRGKAERSEGVWEVSKIGKKNSKMVRTVKMLKNILNGGKMENGGNRKKYLKC